MHLASLHIRRLLGEEPPHIRNPPRPAGTGQAGDDLLAIPLGVDTGVEDGDRPSVSLGADETAYPLLEHQDRLGQCHLVERLAALVADQLLAILYHRVAMRGKGQFVYDDERKRRAGDVYSSQKLRVAKSHCTGGLVQAQVEQLGAGEAFSLAVTVVVQVWADQVVRFPTATSGPHPE